MNKEHLTSIREVVKRDKANTILIDIRDRERYNRGHIVGAISMPEEEIFENYRLLEQYEKVFIYCDYGNKGLRIVNDLITNYNIKNVYNVVGGYNVYRGKIEMGSR